jgi:hypothetical protein
MEKGFGLSVFLPLPLSRFGNALSFAPSFRNLDATCRSKVKSHSGDRGSILLQFDSFSAQPHCSQTSRWDKESLLVLSGDCPKAKPTTQGPKRRWPRARSLARVKELKKIALSEGDSGEVKVGQPAREAGCP